MTVQKVVQGRARGLYDEQLQRQQQEKLFRFAARVVVADTVLIESHPEPSDPASREPA